MTYSITDDFKNHGYSQEVARKVEYLLNGIISCPGLFVFNKKDKFRVNIFNDGFIDMSGGIDVLDDDIRIDFLMQERNNQTSHYHYEDGKIQYVLSNPNGIYIIKGNVSDTTYKIRYYSENAKNHIINKNDLYDNPNEILIRPKKNFKEAAIKPDYKYSVELDPKELSMTPSSFIFSPIWIDDCHSYMEGESYETFSPNSKNMKLEKKRKKKKHQQ